jgi:hypothetical protein
MKMEALMKLFVTRCVVGSILVLSSTLLSAQGVFVTQGENGPVFSDKPQPGAKEVTLKPLNVVPLPKAPKVTAPVLPVEPEVKEDLEKADAVLQAYQTFAVIYPENNGSIVANTAVFDVRVSVEPALKLGEGHAFVVSLNGRPVGQRFTATEFMIPPEFWGDNLPAPNQVVQLDASIIDANDQVLQKAAPIRFTLRYATVMNRPKPQRPPVPPKVIKPKLPLEPAPGSATILKQKDK